MDLPPPSKDSAFFRYGALIVLAFRRERQGWDLLQVPQAANDACVCGRPSTTKQQSELATTMAVKDSEYLVE